MNARRMRSILTALIAVLWVSCAGLSYAQSMNAGDISGIVRDTSGAAVPGVTVTVLNKSTGVSKDYHHKQ